MRIGIFTIGIILIIVGIFLFFHGNSTIHEIESYDIYGLPISDFFMLLSPDLKSQYELAQTMKVVGFGFGVVGLVVCIAGIAASSTKPQVVTQTEGSTQNNETSKILKLRYAKGEITKEVYEQMKKDIEG